MTPAVNPVPGPSVATLAVAVVLLVTVAGYALFAGADLGGGTWDLLAGGDERGARPREEIDASVTPVWEGNHVWIIFGLVVFWTGFPSAFSAVMVALFVPLALSLLGIVLRGIGFAFRHEAQRPATTRLYGALFAASSLLTPFFLGTAVGGVATGAVPADPAGNLLGAWTSPTALVTGLLFVATCAYVAGVYLVADCERRGHDDLARYFRRRSLAAGLVTGLLAAINLVLLARSAPYLWAGLTGPALPAVAVSVLGGIAALALLLTRRPMLLRGAAALAVVGVVAGWGVAQYPWVLPGAVTLSQSAAPEPAQLALLVALGLALVLVFPAFVWLYWLQQHGMLQESSPPSVPAGARGREDVAERTPPPAMPVRAAADRHRGLEAVVLLVVAGSVLRDAVRQLTSGRRRRR
ncbi:cytochrome d ubiquinol oxidase subunit II [Pseudonocardia kujensis]|uniref:cytochrome d ubiquinol oxidase subunit II n=1 Tax=Pseudonocardia kujensis TaxID=1128675 RepID=UPI001E42F072|nr:cytochrome d ubiquinol oxidase subunit II [Pseudonocardia kujensis]MCE0762239.1 cytochrome d ubiquinol oxidase subunit II [Pseudonocardia kujensis]